MRGTAIALATCFLAGSTLCCVCPPMPRIEAPEIHINVPTIEVGETQEKQETIPLDEARSVSAEIRFGAGELTIESGTADELFSGSFSYNVAEWEPQITYENGSLIVEQGHADEDWGVLTGDAYNRWELRFSPQVPLEMELKIGAGDGDLDLTGLQLEGLDMEIGAGDFTIRFDEQNQADMERFDLDAGASKLEVNGIGYASPKRMTVRGGVGDISLDFTGDWPHSADIDVQAGVGSVTLRLPDNVGAQVGVEGGLSSVEATDLRHEGDAYVNDAFGEAETELRIHVTTGVGSLRLIEVAND